MSDQFINEFLQEMADVVPLDSDNKVVLQKAQLEREQAEARRKFAQLSEQHQRFSTNHQTIDKIKPLDMLSFKLDGVQEGVFKNLRLGKYKVNSVLNVMGLSVPQARDALLASLEGMKYRGERCLLVKHGQAENSHGYATMKSFINAWLMVSDDIQAFHEAPSQLGGRSAVIALFKKSQQKKQENRERHRRG